MDQMETPQKNSQKLRDGITLIHVIDAYFANKEKKLVPNKNSQKLLANLISSIDRSSEILQMIKNDLLAIYDESDDHLENYVLDEVYRIKSEITLTQQRCFSLLKKTMHM